ncbi:hypothetical protein BS47DRAFT_756261 [Hydnum rufescens UP504]|uniref:Uncharacterized protein n=1 Tax=Hydnum rufescens UP504 TaxID=1448309 RepID=A0A9P6B9R3_9AGAM|nr:hypothetical protein BS47DRAFT_756261 [Hydnum rufescens UP504]
MCRSASMRSLVSLVHDDSYSPSDVGLDFKVIAIEGFGKLGARRDALEALQSVRANYPQGIIMPTPLIIRKDHRVHATLSLFNILGSLAMSKFGMVDLPDLVLLVLLVASHRSSPPEVGRGASACIGGWLEIESVTLHVQREICRNIVRATLDWSVRQKSHILEFIPQSSASAARLLSWTAYGMLIPREMEKATLERYVNPPPLSRLLEHLFAKNPSKEEMDPSELNPTERLFDLGEADKSPNYVDIMYQVEILSHMLCDVRAVVEFEYKHGLARGSSSTPGTNAGHLVSKSPSKAKARQMTPLEILCEGLESKHDRIGT